MLVFGSKAVIEFKVGFSGVETRVFAEAGVCAKAVWQGEGEDRNECGSSMARRLRLSVGLRAVAKRHQRTVFCSPGC